jgi:hypothetical protein
VVIALTAEGKARLQADVQRQAPAEYVKPGKKEGEPSAAELEHQAEASAEHAKQNDKQAGKAQQHPPRDTRTLSLDEQRYLLELQTRDSEVRAHEGAHQAAGGGLTGGASFSFTTGPDGRQYAVGGEVSIDMSGGSSPDQTIALAQRIRAAAMAPADPSGADRAVAAAASQMQAEAFRAKAAMAAQKAAERNEPPPEVKSGGPKPAEAAAAARTDGESSQVAPSSQPNPAEAAARLSESRESAEPSEAPRPDWDLAPQGGHGHLKTDCGFCVRAVASYG